MSAIDRYLYIGTTRGTVLVTEAKTLAPLCVFQCHAAEEFYIKAIIPVMSLLENSRTAAGKDENEEDETVTQKHRVPAVVTVGKGYSNILKVGYLVICLIKP